MSYSPETTFEGKNIVTGTAAALVPTLDVRKYRTIAFSISGLTSETISLGISFDGNTWFDGMMPTVLTTNANAAATTLGNGTYAFGAGNMPCAFIRFTKSAGVENATIRFGFRN